MMSSNRIYIIFILLSVCITSQAGTPKRFNSLMRWVDSADVAGCDTAYVALPRHGFTAYLNHYLSGSSAHLHVAATDPDFHKYQFSGSLRTTPSLLLSAGISYRGWGLSYSRDFSKYGDTEFSYNFYAQRYGLEFRRHNSYSLHGSLDTPSSEGASVLMPLDKRMGRLRTTLLNAYYIFERRRFSHPAAALHTTIQRRSCGSWLAILNYWHGTYDAYRDDLPLSFRRLSLSHVNIGAGYAYNYVFGNQHCLLHGAMTPVFDIWHRNLIYHSDIQQSLDRDMAAGLVAHLHFVYNQGRFLTGFQSIFNYSFAPNEDELSIHSIDWTTRVFVGLRF